MIKSEDENQFVSDLLRNTTGARDGWIGLHRKADNKFYWLDGRPVDGNYEKWNKGEPSDGNEDCVHLHGGNSDGTWNERSCSYANKFRCCLPVANLGGNNCTAYA